MVFSIFVYSILFYSALLNSASVIYRCLSITLFFYTVLVLQCTLYLVFYNVIVPNCFFYNGVALHRGSGPARARCPCVPTPTAAPAAAMFRPRSQLRAKPTTVVLCGAVGPEVATPHHKHQEQPQCLTLRQSTMPQNWASACLNLGSQWCASPRHSV